MTRNISCSEHWGKLQNHLTAESDSNQLCIPPASTVPHGGQMESLWGKRQVISNSAQNPLFQQSTQYHTVVRWKVCEERGRWFRTQHRTLYSNNQHSTTRSSDGKLVRREAWDLDHLWELPQVSFLSRQKYACHNKSFITTKVLLWQT